ncbi:MAG: hypothetical protein PR2021_3660 [Candidatus Phytoplasma pruni]|uniref:hypothetical protein n=1 Tax=Poinsettia branch-inducing phytoplasma TaxID=138647 RepID=UPI00036CE37D|nr:hypothetical protein [Poinsettia branch-inducing phytoplasma]WEK82434.1 MAG: hypothetical protein PR2021_3660 [Candidatus Phytoplasma pruni]
MTKKEIQQKILSLEKELKLLYNEINKNKGVYVNIGNNLDIKKDIEKTQINIFDVANYIINQKYELNHLRLHKIIYFSHISSLIKRRI